MAEFDRLIGETLASPRIAAEDLEPDGKVSCLSLPVEVQDYDFYTEEINIDSIEYWLNVQGVRFGAGLFTELYSLRQRALQVRPDGGASLPVTSYAAPTLTNLKSHAITGIYFQKPARDEMSPPRKKARGTDVPAPQAAGAVPACAVAEMSRGIPGVWVGRGLDSLSWEAAIIALPQATHKVALAHPTLSLLGACARAAQVDLSPLLQQCVREPIALVKAMQRLLGPNDVVCCLEAIVAGASSRQWLAESGASQSREALKTMYAFELEVKRLHRLIYDSLLNDTQRTWLAAHTQQPRAMAFHLLYNSCSRACADRMRTALQDGVVLHCRGTCCLVQATAAQLSELMNKLQEALPSLKFEASGVDNIKAVLSARFPDVDFAAKAEVAWEKYGAAHWACCDALVSTKPHSRMTDLSAYLAMRFKDEINLPAEHNDSKFERFVDGAWDTRDIKHLAEPIEAALKSLIPTGTAVEYDLPLPLGCRCSPPVATLIPASVSG